METQKYTQRNTESIPERGLISSHQGSANHRRWPTPLVVGLVVAPIVVPALAGLLSGNLHTLVGAAAVSAALLLAARLASGLEIRWYAMAFMLFVVLNLGRIFGWRLGNA